MLLAFGASFAAGPGSTWIIAIIPYVLVFQDVAMK
jgi:hypothetical protein